MVDTQPDVALRHYLTAFGTRPEIIKLAPVVAELRTRGNRVTVVNTGQHSDARMNADFCRDLGMHVDVALTPVGTPDEAPGQILTGAIAEVASSRPDALVLLGDTITVPLFAIAARRAGLPLIHLEAGLRSRNGRSLEEVNRRMAAVAASISIAPTPLAAHFLLAEGIPLGRVFTLGNTITDALRIFGPPRVPVDERRGVLVTAHRASNVDSPERLTRIVDLIVGLTALGPVTFPVHPRTASRLHETGLQARLDVVPDLVLLDPVGYPRMLDLLSGSRLVVTDSGGVQEECSWYGVPAVVLRRSTPRWEGVRDGAVVLAGIDSDEEIHAILETAARLWTDGEQDRVAALDCPYGDGHVAARIADLLGSSAASALLRLTEETVDPDSLPWEGP